MANDKLLDLMYITSTDSSAPKTRGTAKFHKNDISLIDRIMFCDPSYRHPIHDIMMYEFRCSLRYFYTNYKNLMKALLDRINEFPHITKNKDECDKLYKDLICFKKSVCNEKYEYWYNYAFTKLSNCHTDVIKDLNASFSKLDDQIRIIIEIHNELQSRVARILVHYNDPLMGQYSLYASTLETITKAMMHLRSIIMKLSVDMEDLCRDHSLLINPYVRG